MPTGTHEIICRNHCGGGGGKGWLLVLAGAVVLVVGALAYKVRHGIATGVHVVFLIGEIVFAIIGAAVAAGVVYLAFRAIRGIVRRVQNARDLRAARAPAPSPMPARTVLTAEPVYRVTQLGNPAPVAIEPPRRSWDPVRSENWVPGARDPRDPQPAEVDDGNARNHSQYR